MSLSSRTFKVACTKASTAWVFYNTQKRSLFSSRPAQVSAEPIFSNKQLKKWLTLSRPSACVFISSRNATQQSPRKSQQSFVKEEERIQSPNSTSPHQRSPSNKSEQQLPSNNDSQQYGSLSDVTLESLITPEIGAHIVKVYATLAMTSGLTALGGAASIILLPAASLGTVAVVSGITGFFAILAICFTDPSRVQLRQSLLFGAATLLGVVMAPFLSVVAPETIVTALAGTTAIFAGFSVAALRAKSDTFLKYGGALLGALFCLIGLSLFNLIAAKLGLPIPPAVSSALYSVELYGGLLLFSLYVSYFTSTMIHAAREGHMDHVTHALSLFLSVVNIFDSLIDVFRSGGK